jgi:hypothetical protein
MALSAPLRGSPSMRMSSLQIGLIVAGIVLVIGVILYNRWQERRIRRRIETAFRGGEPAPRAPSRVEPTLVGVESGQSASATPAHPGTEVTADPDWSPPLDDVRTLDPSPAAARVPLPADAVYSSGAGPQPDPDIECVVILQPAKPVSGGAVAAGLHARLGKPLRWFGRRTAGAPWQRLASDTPGEFAEFAACLLLADRNGAAGQGQIESFLRVIAEIAPTLPAALLAPEAADESARADALDRLCAELDMQIGITIHKGDAAPIAGTRLRGVAEAAGFRLAPSGRYEFVQEETGAVVYSLQSLTGEPFSLDGLRSGAETGVVFLLDVPRVADPARAFDQMKLAAKRLAVTLGGEIVDDNRRPLKDDALARIREQVVAADAALRQVHIEPGSPRALKLFAA